MYKELSNEELSTLETCQLISEHEQSLKSTQNYRECFQKLLQGNYLNKNVIPWPADWPGWYYPKKKIALGKCSQLRQSVIPEQGQFHVSLNAAEDAVTIFKHFFEKLFKTVFGTDLPHKPKTYKVTLCLTAALLDGSKSEIKFFRNLESAKTMNMFLSYIYLNMYLPWYSSNITSLGVVISYNMKT